MATALHQESFLPVPTSDRAQDVAGAALAPTPSLQQPTPPSRKNHLYLGFLCDTRRAIVGVNTVSILLNITMLIMFEVVFAFIVNHTDEWEAEHPEMSDTEQQHIEEEVSDGTMKIVEDVHEAFITASCLMHMCGIYGALTFQKWGVYVAATAYVLAFLLSLARPNWQLILPIVLGYPHYFFIKELRDGTMAPYTYHTVAYCACTSGRSKEVPLYADESNQPEMLA